MKRLILAVALASVAATGAAVAQNVNDMAGPRAGKGPLRGLMRADTNRDGIITRAEATAAANARFALIDANKDGRSTAEERTAVRAARRAAKGLAAPARAGSAAIGIVTRDTFQARALKRFDRADPNKDGRIDAAELADLRAHRDGRRGAGRHGPGRGGAGLRGMMMLADANRDGVLTQAETVAGAQAMFERVDANRDGRVTREEMDAMRGPRGGPGHGPDGMMRPAMLGDLR